MPKAPYGARRATNPSKSSSSAGGAGAAKRPTKGGQSPKHRGWRPDASAPTGGASGGASGGPKKARWNADERQARGREGDRPRGDRARDDRAPRQDRGARPVRGERPNWEPRGKDARVTERSDRFGRDDRGARPARDDRDARPARDDRARGRFDRDDRAPRRFDRDERPARGSDRDDRPRRDERDARPARSSDRDARPARRDDRAEGFSRPARSGRDDDRRGSGFPSARDRDDRAPRRDERDARPARTFDRDARPARSFDRDSRPARTFDRDERPVRRHDDSSFFPSADAKAREASRDDVVLERLEAEAIQANEVEGVTFADLGLGSNIVRVLGELGAASPFPIQAATIPDVLSSRDVLGRGRTGSGKTIAFGAPLVERLLQLNADAAPGQRRKPGRAPKAIILAPTRELALQIDRTVQPIAQSVGLFTTQLYGGVPYPRQVGALQRGVDIVIGTPGRIEDLVEQGRLDLSQIAITVLDEADHMSDLGFLEPMQRLLRRMPSDSQKLLFSATLDSGVAALVDEFLTDPAVHEVAGEDQESSTIEHRVFLLDQRDKQTVLAELASGPGKKLVFARTRAFAEDLTDMLEDHGIRAVALHGDLNQARRTRNLERLTSGRAQVLVATDVAARGIHVDDIELVIQADAPDEYKTYLHRSGRTGRAGKDGVVVTLVPFNRRRRTQDLLQRAEIEAEWTEVRPGDAIIAELSGEAAAS